MDRASFSGALRGTTVIFVTGLVYGFFGHATLRARLRGYRVFFNRHYLGLFGRSLKDSVFLRVLQDVELIPLLAIITLNVVFFRFLGKGR